MLEPRTFTLAEATALLPVIRQLLIEIQECKAGLDQQSAVLDAIMVMSGGNGSMAADIESAKLAISEAAERLERLIGELTETGAELKGIDEGLIDFPSEREGRTVYLCWRLGEDAITWWHELDTGFGGRQPL